MNTREIRRLFLDFFKENDHQEIASSSLVPTNDPTLLFTNAGMVQFKEIFLGLEQADYQCATSSQKCVRAGGKHNDLENVGYTARHHTFFEMLGNFSFGDYFKREAIKFAWEFLTKILKLPKEKLWITVYKDDKESADIWLNEIKINKNYLSFCDEKDNFWSMGETGPCGPSSEIFYDHGASIPGGPPGSIDADGDRYVEIWNLVFMQYNRTSSGELKPLPRPAVDTGMGLERIAAVMQGVHNNFEIDLFNNLINGIAKIVSCKDKNSKALRVIADHLRACAFLVLDGIIPSNEGRGYVLRRIMRRALRYGYMLGKQEPFFYSCVKLLAIEMGDAYPSLLTKKSEIEKVFKKEEHQFAKTLGIGLKILEEYITNLTANEISGEVIFKLYDTYGFPVDLLVDIAKENSLYIDMAGFSKEMKKQQQRAINNQTFNKARTILPTNINSKFLGYESLQANSIIREIYQTEQPLLVLENDKVAVIILEQSPFYGESGGQIGDIGILQTSNSNFQVLNTYKQGKTILHYGKLLTGKLAVADNVTAKVDAEHRKKLSLNHSATHLLHTALKKVLGTHVTQQGSLVEAAKLRFDFTHEQPINNKELRAVELLVNLQISKNLSVQTTIMPIKDAIKSGAIALFNEKYDEQVRVLRIGDFSTELCGGTHVKKTGEIGYFKIISETSIASGIKRIEAITGELAVKWSLDQQEQLSFCANKLNSSRANLVSKLENILEKNKFLEKKIRKLEERLYIIDSENLISKATDINGIKLIINSYTDESSNFLRQTAEQLKCKLPSAIIVLSSINGGKIILITAVTKSCLKYIKAHELVNFVAKQIGGKGGGRPDLAQGGGSELTKLSKALGSVPAWVAEKL